MNPFLVPSRGLWQNDPVNPRNFFGELKRRNVYRAAVAYGVVAWFLTQLTTQVFPLFEITTAAIRFVVIALAIGFPIAMSIAWLYELTPEGIVRTDDIDPARVRSVQRSAGRLLDFIIIGVLLLIIAMLVYERRPFRIAPAPSISGKSIAVLPFGNLSSDPDNAFFAEGVQDEILTNLARVADLKVISRTSVSQYREAPKRNLRDIALALGVSHVLEGSVQRASNRVRVSAQLIDARTDNHIWADTYDRDLADVFAIQTEIANAIVQQLHAKISPDEKTAIEKAPTADSGAYDLYLRARGLFADTTSNARAREKLPESARLLEEAVARDPKFVAAWCLLSNVHGTIYYQDVDHTPERLRQVEVAAQTALRIDPQSGPAHLAIALYYYRGFRDFTRARAELAIARRTLPNDPEVLFFSGVFDYRQGNWAAATRTLERAIELDPRNLFYLQQMALCYQPQRRYADELRTWNRVLSIRPGDAATRMCAAAVSCNARGDVKPYQITLAALMSEDPESARELDDPYHSLCERTPEAAARLLSNYSPQGAYEINYPRAYWAGVIARWQKDEPKALSEFSAAREEVEKIVHEQPNFAAARSLLGLINAGLGRKEEAIREGERACELLPMSTDAVDGVGFAVNLAQVYAWAGEKERAIAQLAKALKVPNDCHYGELLLHPLWDVLRGEPAFEKLVASQGPN